MLKIKNDFFQRRNTNHPTPKCSSVLAGIEQIVRHDPVFEKVKRSSTFWRSPSVRFHFLERLQDKINLSKKKLKYVSGIKRSLSGGVCIENSTLKNTYIDHPSPATRIEYSFLKNAALYHNVRLSNVSILGLPELHVIIAGNVTLKDVNVYLVSSNSLLRASKDNDSAFICIEELAENLKNKKEQEAYYFPNNCNSLCPEDDNQKSYKTIVTKKNGRVLAIYKSNTVSIGAHIDGNNVAQIENGGLRAESHQIIPINDIPELAIWTGKIAQNFHNLAHGFYGNAYDNPDSLRAWLGSIFAGLQKSLTGAEIHQGAVFNNVQIAFLPTEWSWLGSITKFVYPKTILPKGLTVVGQQVVIDSPKSLNIKQKLELPNFIEGLQLHCLMDFRQINFPFKDLLRRKNTAMLYFPPETITLGATGARTEWPEEVKKKFPNLASLSTTRHPIIYIQNIPPNYAVKFSGAILGPKERTIDGSKLS